MKNNITVLRMILTAMGRDPEDFDWVADRPGHDRRYAIDSTKLQRELGWRPAHTDFAEGLADHRLVRRQRVLVAPGQGGHRRATARRASKTASRRTRARAPARAAGHGDDPASPRGAPVFQRLR
ncbi:MAG: hypothetical protein ACLU0O_10710 [Collinsella sp.]